MEHIESDIQAAKANNPNVASRQGDEALHTELVRRKHPLTEGKY